ncbi:MAG: DUF2225 domain-containing protein [Spartobacteria bacterium]|nr:DUF2225 domain-containing protein [Spartobacteria bacterium]
MIPRSKKEKEGPKPMVRCKVRCPMCESASYQYKMNTRVYWNREIDVDLQPYNYAMLEHIEADKKYHPPLYYMWYCPECHFTSGYRHFIHPLKDVYVRVEAVRERIADAYQNDRAFRKKVKELSRGIDIENMDFYQGIKLHLLAVVILELIEDVVKQYFLNLGRYCLHLGWLYRDMQSDPDEAVLIQPKLDQLFTDLEDVWPDMPRSEYDALHKAANYYDQTFERSPLVKTVIDEVSILQVIARIYIKLDRSDEAKKLINDSVDRASESKSKIDEKLKQTAEDREVNPTADTAEMVTQSRRLRSLIDDGKQLIQFIADERLARQTDFAKAYIKENKSKGRDALAAILEKKRIDRRVIEKLLPKPKKKGFFSW